jgi:hypothetical protein
MELPDDADTQKIDTEYYIWPRCHPQADSSYPICGIGPAVQIYSRKGVRCIRA